MAPGDRNDSAPGPADRIAATAAIDAVRLALNRGPIGAYIVAIIAVAILFIGWLGFYFLLFLPRGPVG